ncbi:unnamed protein product, partial [Rotaria magnacalcarata]
PEIYGWWGSAPDYVCPLSGTDQFIREDSFDLTHFLELSPVCHDSQ